MIELSVVIPSRARERLLSETLRLALGQAAEPPVEVIVVYDGPSTERRLAGEPAGSPETLRVVERPALGPAAARNHGISIARGGACLFLGDDVWAAPGLIDRHLAFHREHGEGSAALLGRVEPAPPLDRSRFIRWLHTDGVQFGYAALNPGPVEPGCFWTANVSAKTALLREVGGFDEAFTEAACEDAELGLRLARAGMTLIYDPEALAGHYHPTDLEHTLGRMARVGRAFRLLSERTPELEMPRRPGARHRLKAATLTAAALLGREREATWRFLCDEAQREAYWGVRARPGARLRIGNGLARIAMRTGEEKPADGKPG